MTLVVVDAVGLTPRALRDMPRLSRLGAEGFMANVRPVLPAVTCPVQASMLTRRTPAEHGIVGNGWYFRELGEVLFWRQHNRLVDGEKVWETARRANPGFRAGNVCWWYAMGATTDVTVTPRPIYHADGRKSPDCYARPSTLHARLTDALGPFPLFRYWGPGADITSSRWIANAARMILDDDDLDLLLVYLPHLDYDLQRFGPDSPQAITAARELDGVAGDLVDWARDRGDQVVVVSEYGITPARRPVDVNRALRRAGYLNVYAQAGMEYLDPWTSRAFAVADHQIAHVYVADPADLPGVRSALAGLAGVGELLDGDDLVVSGLAHRRAGELVALAERDSWFTYRYWLDDERAPDFARQVEIHRKPGYDPAELLMDPEDRTVKLRAAMALARKATGMRYALNVVGLNGSEYVRGTHGLLPETTIDGPVLLCSEAAAARAELSAPEVGDLLLDLAGCRTPRDGAAAASRRRGVTARKDEQLTLAAGADVVHLAGTGLDRFRLRHHALPERDLEDVDLQTELLGRVLCAPLLVSAMTGGTAQAGEVNRALARAASEQGIGLALGSGRVLLDDPRLVPTFFDAGCSPRPPLLIANVGAAQLRGPGAASRARRIVELLDADALFVHLNALQEAIQPEGEPHFAGIVDALAEVAEEIAPTPLAVKEVGFGMDEHDVSALCEAGVAAIDIAGAGGTNWATIEGLRSPDGARTAAAFGDWGVPTAEAVVRARRRANGLPIVASGGLRDGIDAAKCIALGASAAAFGRPLLLAARAGEASEWVRAAVRQLRIATWLAGEATSDALGPWHLEIEGDAREVEACLSQRPEPS